MRDMKVIAAAFHYSKFHLHRMFTRTVGITIHDYIRRRRLTEAARQLVFSDKSVMEIAVAAGYESRQAFAGVFKSMYKKTPGEYKKNQAFYPLQLPLDLNRNPSVSDNMPGEIGYAVQKDIPGWMNFVPLVIDGFPGYDQEQHQRRLVSCVEEKQALIMRGDPADTGQREAYIRLRFSEAEFLTEFGYPTQRMVLERKESQGVLAGTKSSDTNRCARIC